MTYKEIERDNNLSVVAGKNETTTATAMMMTVMAGNVPEWEKFYMVRQQMKM